MTAAGVTTLQVGLLGAGWISRIHVPAIDKAQDVELVAVGDTELARARAIAEPRGARAYADWEKMLDGEELDAVWICTPPLHHRGPAVAALRRGVHVYLEKPIARTMSDADAIVEASAGSNAICAVGYQWHAIDLLAEVRAALRDQQIGMLLGRNFGPVAGRPWFLDQAQGGGQILERASHHIDLQRAIAGEIRAVEAAAGSVRLAEPSSPASIDDAVALLFHFEGGSLGSVHSVWSRDGQPELYATDILATEATLALQLGPDAFMLTGTSRGQPVHAESVDPMAWSIGGFLDAVRLTDPTRVFCPPEDAIRTLAVALACERALESGRRVEV